MGETPTLSLLAASGGDPQEGPLWTGLRQSFGLTPEQWRRLTQVVTLHMALDRLLFLRVCVGLAVVAGRKANADRITRRVSKMRFLARLELAQDAGWVEDELAADVIAVNALRNRLLHFDSKRVDTEAPEIVSADAFDKFTERGMRAWKGLVAQLQPLIDHFGNRPPPPPT
jgi:hypothetical protein